MQLFVALLDGMSFGAELKTMREQRGLTQHELAELIGVSYQAIQHYEKGRKLPRKNHLRSLAEALGVEAGRLFDLAAPSLAAGVSLEEVGPTLGAPQKNPPPEDPPELADLLNKAREVLTSDDPITSGALKSNIIAFHQAVVISKQAVEDRKRAELEKQAREAKIEDLQKRVCDTPAKKDCTGEEGAA